jgi:hypothetical protein
LALVVGKYGFAADRKVSWLITGRDGMDIPAG